MAEIKNYDADGRKNDLKFADAEKSSGSSQQSIATDNADNGLRTLMETKSFHNQARKRIPLFWDIIIGIIMLAMIVGAVVGAYHLFRYFTEDSERVELEYKIIKVSNEEDLTAYRTLRNKPLYLDTEGGNTLYFGTVLSAEVYELKDETGSDMLVVIIKAPVKYKPGDGYTIGGYRIAVGSSFTLRSYNMTVKGDVVEVKNRTAESERIAAESIGAATDIDGEESN